MTGPLKLCGRLCAEGKFKRFVIWHNLQHQSHRHEVLSLITSYFILRNLNFLIFSSYYKKNFAGNNIIYIYTKELCIIIIIIIITFIIHCHIYAGYLQLRGQSIKKPNFFIYFLFHSQLNQTCLLQSTPIHSWYTAPNVFCSSGTRPGTCFAGWREGPLSNFFVHTHLFLGHIML